MQNTSKWKGKLFCLFFFFHKKCWLAFVFEESYSFYVFFLPEALWGDEVGEWLCVGAGTLLLMFPGFGHGVSVCTHKPGLAAKECAETKARACCGSPQENGFIGVIVKQV